MKTTLALYCQYQMISMNNYTGTYLAKHYEGLSHDSVYRFLKEHRFTPKLVWEKARSKIVMDEDGYLIFDDTVLNKEYSFEIEGVRRQWSGNARAVIKGIGIVNLVYYNPHMQRWWIIDFRIFDPERDGKSKIDHMNEMLTNVGRRGIVYRVVLFDSWYATANLLKRIDVEGKIFYTTIKSNRLVDDSGGKNSYQPVHQLGWTAEEQEQGKKVKIKKTSKHMKVKLFRVIASQGDTEYIITNDITQCSSKDAQKVNAFRWKIEQFHREKKQVTGIEKCQCRLNRSQRNHILCSILVWCFLSHVAFEKQQTIYQIKQGLFSHYLIQQLKTPLLQFQ